MALGKKIAEEDQRVLISILDFRSCDPHLRDLPHILFYLSLSLHLHLYAQLHFASFLGRLHARQRSVHLLLLLYFLQQVINHTFHVVKVMGILIAAEQNLWQIFVLSLQLFRLTYYLPNLFVVFLILQPVLMYFLFKTKHLFDQKFSRIFLLFLAEVHQLQHVQALLSWLFYLVSAILIDFPSVFLYLRL